MEELQKSFFDDDYEVILDNYQGPIELLYSLVKESKMSIDEVKLGELTTQYIEHMKQMPELDIEEATKFIQVVAILLEIKTKMILPQEAEDVEDENDTEYLMKLLLKEYEILHEATEELTKKENNNYFYKEPDKIVTEYKVVLGDMKMDDMLDAFAKMLSKLNEKEREQIIEREIPKDRWTVAEKITSISTTLKQKRNCKFSSFFEDGYSKGEVITVFLALLELLKRHFVKVNQENNFDDIDIVYNEEFTENDVQDEQSFDEYK
jgi:segregation and condensation protein A